MNKLRKIGETRVDDSDISKYYYSFNEEGEIVQKVLILSVGNVTGTKSVLVRYVNREGTIDSFENVAHPLDYFITHFINEEDAMYFQDPHQLRVVTASAILENERRFREEMKKVGSKRKTTTKKEMLEVIDKTFAECKTTYETANQEYALSEDALANFKRVGESLNLSPEKVLMVYTLKHIDGICSYVEGFKSQREDVRGRIKDVIVYMCLLRGLVEEVDNEFAPTYDKE